MRAIPLGAKLSYSAFVAVLVPYYWVTHTPWNFFYFCDMALLLTLVGVWTENAFLISMQAVAIAPPPPAPTHAVLARTVRSSDQSSEAANVGR